MIVGGIRTFSSFFVVLLNGSGLKVKVPQIEMSGRKGDEIWQYFLKKIVPGKSGSRAICKVCKHELQGLVARLKKHREKCTGVIDNTIVTVDDVGKDTYSDDNKNINNPGKSAVLLFYLMISSISLVIIYYDFKL
jgi:hypothetical protein